VAELAKTSKDEEVRAAAVPGITTLDAYVPVLIEIVEKDPSAKVRAAAAKGLVGRKEPAMIPVLVAASAKDEPEVRAAAAEALARTATAEGDAAVCKVMLDDADEGVRGTAVKALTGVRRAGVLDCIVDRVRKEEPNEALRAGYLAMLRAYSTDESKAVLCKEMGPWVKKYVTDALPPERETPSDIVFVQNDIDYEKSYECVTKALSTPGLTCHGRYHLTSWAVDLGGKQRVKPCPGMAPDGSGGREVIFE
jgi:hypothetical protein